VKTAEDSKEGKEDDLEAKMAGEARLIQEIADKRRRASDTSSGDSGRM
jgi:hypothetical protein